MSGYQTGYILFDFAKLMCFFKWNKAGGLTEQICNLSPMSAVSTGNNMLSSFNLQLFVIEKFGIQEFPTGNSCMISPEFTPHLPGWRGISGK